MAVCRRKESGNLPGPFHGAREGSPLTAEPRIARRWFRVPEAAALGCVRRRCAPHGAGGRGGWGHTCVRGPLAARFGPISCRWRAERSAIATVSPVFAPVAVLPAFEGPSFGPSAPVSAPFRLRRSTSLTLSVCFGPIPASKVHPLDPRRLFWRHFGFERSILWTLGTCFGAISASKVHLLDPQHPFRRHSGFDGPSLGPSAPVSAPFRLRRSIPWTLDDTILVATKRLIISKMLIILGPICAEDFQEVVDYQLVSNQRSIRTCAIHPTDLHR